MILCRTRHRNSLDQTQARAPRRARNLLKLRGGRAAVASHRQNGESRLNALTLMQTDICVTESLRNNTTGRVCLQRPRQAFGSGAGASEASEYFLCNVSLYSAPRSQFDIMRQVGQCRTATVQTTRTTHPLRCPTAVPRKHSADCRCLDLPDSKATMR